MSEKKQPRSVACPSCGKSYPWRDGYANITTQCRTCGGKFQMPSEPTGKAKAVADPSPTTKPSHAKAAPQAKATPDRNVAAKAPSPATPEPPAAAPATDAVPQGSDGDDGLGYELALDDLLAVEQSGSTGPMNRAAPGGAAPLAPATDAAPADKCPSCGAKMEPAADICPACCFDRGIGKRLPASVALNTDTQSPLGVPSYQIGGKQKRDPKHVSISDVFKAPFDPMVTAEAFGITLTWAILQICGIFVVILLSLFFGILAKSGLQLLVIPLALGAYGFIIVRVYGWYFGRMFAICEQFESDAMMTDDNRNPYLDFVFGLVVFLIGFVPAILVPIAGLIWFAVYTPMGLAMAGAERTINPAKVVAKIGQSFPTYLMVLLFNVPLGFLSYFAAFAAAGYMIKNNWPPLIWMPIATFIFVMTMQFVTISSCAMVGRTLLKYKQEKPMKPQELGEGVAWIGAAAGLCALAVLLALFQTPKNAPGLGKLRRMVFGRQVTTTPQFARNTGPNSTTRRLPGRNTTPDRGQPLPRENDGPAEPGHGDRVPGELIPGRPIGNDGPNGNGLKPLPGRDGKRGEPGVGVVKPGRLNPGHGINGNIDPNANHGPNGNDGPNGNQGEPGAAKQPPAAMDSTANAVAVLNTSEMGKRQEALAFLKRAQVEDPSRDEVVAALKKVLLETLASPGDYRARAERREVLTNLTRWASDRGVAVLSEALKSRTSSEARMEVLAALAGAKDPNAYQRMVKHLAASSDERERALIGSVLRQAGPVAEPAVRAMLKKDHDQAIRRLGITLIAEYKSKDSVPTLLEAMHDEDSYIARSAEALLKELAPGKVDAVAVALRRAGNAKLEPGVRQSALITLAAAGMDPKKAERGVEPGGLSSGGSLESLVYQRIRDGLATVDPTSDARREAINKLLVDTLNGREETLHGYALFALSVWGEAKHLSLLYKGLESDNAITRNNAIRAVANMGDDKAAAAITKAMVRRDPPSTSFGFDPKFEPELRALTGMGEAAEPAVLRMLSNRHAGFRYFAITVLDKIGTRKSVRALGYRLRDKDKSVAALAERVRDRIVEREKD